IAELYCDGEHFGELNTESGALQLVLFPRSSGLPWTIAAEEVIDALRDMPGRNSWPDQHSSRRNSGSKVSSQVGGGVGEGGWRGGRRRLRRRRRPGRRTASRRDRRGGRRESASARRRCQS